MFIKKSVVLLTFLFAASLARAVPEIQHWETDNGVPVYFFEAHELPMIDIQLIFDAGSARDGDKRGVAMLTSSLLDEGAAGKSANRISEEFESLGANFGSSSGYDSGSVSLRSLSEPDLLQKALATFKQVVSQPDFPQKSFERQRERMLVGIRSKQQSPGDLARDAFYSALYGDHPYAWPNEGTEETVQALTRKDVIAFHQQYYVANNAMLAIVGDLDRSEAEALANDIAGVLPAGEKPSAIPAVDLLEESETVRIDHPSTQTHILVGQPGIPFGHPDYFPLYVGNHVLGGGGMVSILFEEIREKRGLSYSAYSYFQQMRQRGPFIAGLQTQTDQAQDALALLKQELERFVAEGPTEEELEASKKNITGGFPLRIDSNSNILNYLAMIGFYDLPLDYLNTFNDNVRKVTVEDVKRAFKKHLSPEKMVSVLVGPAKSS
ncbi:MAG TPA: pitrilysin family protein [Gammaproteobacteria bacterium]|nr:pitrilysin family protein [Gammaproteobacteria bacterium]